MLFEKKWKNTCFKKKFPDKLGIAPNLELLELEIWQEKPINLHTTIKGNPTVQHHVAPLGDDIIYMQDHALAHKFMGLWPLEKSLVWWIKTRWKPKGDVSLKPRSKGFFMTIFNLVKTKKESSKEARISSTPLVYICGSGKRTSSQKRKISLQLRYGSDCTCFRRITDERKF